MCLLSKTAITFVTYTYILCVYTFFLYIFIKGIENEVYVYTIAFFFHSKIPFYFPNLRVLLLLIARGAQGCRVHRGATQRGTWGRPAWEAVPITNSAGTCGALGVSQAGSTKEQTFIFVPENFPPDLTVYFGKVTD